jgi:uncharacterized protein
MSAAQPKSSEPSMEEILASIRKIISDDTGAKPAEPAKAVAPPAINPLPPIQAAPPQASVAVEDDDVMDLMPMAPKPAPAPVPTPVADLNTVIAPPQAPASILDEGPDLDFHEPEEPPAPPPPPVRQATDFEALMAQTEFSPKPPSPSPTPVEGLMSPVTDRVVSTAFSSLASTVLTNNARTLDSVVEDMMRPMIKSWLDDNLPSIVERLIRAEIERVARGGR